MFREQLNYMNLEKEFKKLGSGLNQSLKSASKTLKTFGISTVKCLEASLFYLIDPPKVYRNKSPGCWEEVEKRVEYSHHHHPPNLR